jgi:hypothetical protein
MWRAAEVAVAVDVSALYLRIGLTASSPLYCVGRGRTSKTVGGGLEDSSAGDRLRTASKSFPRDHRCTEIAVHTQRLSSPPSSARPAGRKSTTSCRSRRAGRHQDAPAVKAGEETRGRGEVAPHHAQAHEGAERTRYLRAPAVRATTRPRRLAYPAPRHRLRWALRSLLSAPWAPCPR